MASNGKRMVKEDLIKYLEAVQTNYPDPSDIGGGGTDFTPTNGLEFTEVEGETYLGLTQATSDKIDGAISENSSVDGRLTFNARNYIGGDDICPIALNLRTANSSTTGTNKDATGILFGFYAGDENYNCGRIQFNSTNKQFIFGEMINGSYATVSIPKASYLLENDWPASRTIALGAKVGSTTVYAGNNGVIDLSSQITPSKKIYTISFAPDDEEKSATILGVSDVELEEPDMDTLFSYYDEYTSGQYSRTTQEYYQEQIDNLTNVLRSLSSTAYKNYVSFYYNDNSSTPGVMTNLVLGVWQDNMIIYENGTEIANILIIRQNNVNHLTLTFDNTKLSYMYVYAMER